MVAKWTLGVEILAVIAVKHMQTAYAGFALSLQNKWQYLQRVVANMGAYFAPLKMAIRTNFIPALEGVQSWEVDRGYRELLTHSVQQGGLALCNPVDTTSYGHAASKAVTDHLTMSLIGDPGVMIFNLGQHLETAQVAQTGIESGTTGARAAAPGLTWEGCSHCKVAGTMELCCRGMANSCSQLTEWDQPLHGGMEGQYPSAVQSCTPGHAPTLWQV